MYVRDPFSIILDVVQNDCEVVNVISIADDFRL